MLVRDHGATVKGGGVEGVMVDRIYIIREYTKVRVSLTPESLLPVCILRKSTMIITVENPPTEVTRRKPIGIIPNIGRPYVLSSS